MPEAHLLLENGGLLFYIIKNYGCQLRLSINKSLWSTADTTQNVRY